MKITKKTEETLRRFVPDIRVELPELFAILREDILRRDPLEAAEAKATIAKLERRAQRAEAKTAEAKAAATDTPAGGENK